MSLRSLRILPFLAAGLLAACGQSDSVAPLDTSRVALTARGNLHDNLGRFTAAARFLEESGFLRELVPLERCAPIPERGGSNDEWDDEWDDEGDCRTGLDFTADVERLAQWLEERIFAQGNVESASGGEVVYRLRGDVTCEAWDDDCRSVLDAVAIRLRVTSPVDGDLVIGVEVGAHRPARIDLFRTRFGIEVDLAQVQASLEALDRAASGGGGPGRPFALSIDDDEDLVEMSGRFALNLSSLPGDRFEARVAVLTPISVVAFGADGISFSMAPANPALVAQLDEAARTVSITASVGALDLSGDASAFWGGSTYVECSGSSDGEEECVEYDEPGLEGRLAIHLGGFDGTTTFHAGDGADALQLLAFGLGDETSTISLDGAPIFSLDLNATAGRHADLHLTRTDDGFANLSVSPSLEVALGLQLANLQHQLEVPTWALDERLVLRLDGASPQIRVFTGGDDSPPSVGGEEDDGSYREAGSIEVVSGTLTLESKARPSIVVAAGMCLYGGDEPEVGIEDAAPMEDHPFDDLSVGICEG